MPITERERKRGESERRGRDVKWKGSGKKEAKEKEWQRRDERENRD